MPTVRIRVDGPASFTYGPSRREFVQGIDYAMPDSEARQYLGVWDLEVVGLEETVVAREPPQPPPPLPTRPVTESQRQIERHKPQEPESPQRRRGRPPKR